MKPQMFGLVTVDVHSSCSKCRVVMDLMNKINY